MESTAIKGAEHLISVFGKWPSFHDAEVLTVTLNRDLPSLVLQIFIFETTREVDRRGCYKRDKQRIVTLWFHDVQDLVLEGFNH